MKVLTFKNIVVGVDVSKNSIEILKRAFSLGGYNRSRITIVHAINTTWLSQLFTNVDFSELKENIFNKIENELKSFDTQGLEYQIIIEQENPSTLLVNTAKSIQTSLIIIGENSQENFESKIFGSTAHKVAQNGNIPLLIIKNNYKESYNKIVSFTDFSQVSVESYDFSKALFHKNDINTLSVYMQPSEFMLRYYDKYDNKENIENKIREKSKTEFDNFIDANQITHAELIEEKYSIQNALSHYVTQNQNDLVVLGSTGINNTKALLYGSTASYLLENLACDVLIYVPEIKV